MGFLSGITDTLTNLAKTELEGLKKVVSQSPIDSAKDAVRGYSKLAHEGSDKLPGFMKPFAWLPGGVAVQAVLDASRDAAPKK
jgi:hypothetical protein